MDLLTMIFGLPFAPVRGVIALGEVIQEQVDQELYAPASIRRDLEATEEAAAAGELGEDEAEVQRRAVQRAMRRVPAGESR